MPPLRSMRTIRKIWKNLRPRRAEAAIIWPSGLLRTMMDAITVITSTREETKTLIIWFLGSLAKKWAARKIDMVVVPLTYDAEWTLHKSEPANATLIARPAS